VSLGHQLGLKVVLPKVRQLRKVSLLCPLLRLPLLGGVLLEVRQLIKVTLTPRLM